VHAHVLSDSCFFCRLVWVSAQRGVWWACVCVQALTCTRAVVHAGGMAQSSVCVPVLSWVCVHLRMHVCAWLSFLPACGMCSLPSCNCVLASMRLIRQRRAAACVRGCLLTCVSSHDSVPARTKCVLHTHHQRTVQAARHVCDLPCVCTHTRLLVLTVTCLCRRRVSTEPLCCRICLQSWADMHTRVCWCARLCSSGSVLPVLCCAVLCCAGFKHACAWVQVHACVRACHNVFEHAYTALIWMLLCAPVRTGALLALLVLCLNGFRMCARVYARWLAWMCAHARVLTDSCFVCRLAWVSHKTVHGEPSCRCVRSTRLQCLCLCCAVFVYIYASMCGRGSLPGGFCQYPRAMFKAGQLHACAGLCACASAHMLVDRGPCTTVGAARRVCARAHSQNDVLILQACWCLTELSVFDHLHAILR
jgi:hypothetical protein